MVRHAHAKRGTMAETVNIRLSNLYTLQIYSLAHAGAEVFVCLNYNWPACMFCSIQIHRRKDAVVDPFI